MAKKPRQPKLDSILNSPENINMNEAVRAQIEAAQAQIDKETKEAKQAAKEAKQAAKEIAQQLKKAKKESKQTEKKIPEEEKESFKDKILKLDIEEFNKVFPLLEKIMASKNNKIGNNIASTDLDYNSNTASTDLGINTNTASTDSSYYILTDIVSSQQTSINILKEILTVLKGSSDNGDDSGGLDIDINGSRRGSGGGRSRSSAGRGGRGKYSGLLRTLILGMGAVGGLLGYSYLNSSSNDDEKLNAEPSSTPPPIPAISPAITPIPESQIFDRDEIVSVPIIRMNAANAASNIPRGMTLNPVPTPAGIRLNAGVDTTSAIRLNQSIVPPIPSISLNSTNRVNQTRADLAGITAAQLMGRNQSPAQRINSNTERVFNNLPRPEYGLISPNVNNYNHEPTPPPPQQVSSIIQITRPIENYVRRLNELDRIEESNNNPEGITNPNSNLLTERSSLENGFIQSLSRLNNIPIADRPSPPEGTFERLNLIRQRQGAPELQPIPGPRGGAFAGEQDNTNASLVSSSSVGDYNPEPMPFQRTIASIPQEQRSRTLLAGTTAADLLGRNRDPAAPIDSGTQRAFGAIPQAMNSPAGSRTQRALGFEPEQYGPPAQSSAIVPKTPPAASTTSTAVPKTPPAASTTSTAVPETPLDPPVQSEDAIAAVAAARARRLQATRDIGTRADAFAAGVNRMAAPLTNALSGVQEKRGDTVEEEDGVKQYKADEIVFKADKFDFGNNQDSSTSSPISAASPAPATPPAPPSTGGSGPGSGSSSSAAGATGTSTSTARPMQPPIDTGSRMARDSAANAAAERTMPAAPRPPAATGQNTRAPGGQQRSDVIPQIDPYNPGPLEPADAGSRYARLFGMGVAA
jgi:hypothetical protein